MKSPRPIVFFLALFLVVLLANSSSPADESTPHQAVQTASILEDQVKAGEEEWLEGWRRGPQRVRWQNLPLQLGDAAPDVKLQNSLGEWVNLSDSWRDGPALLIFWRHYGCGCGIERANRLREEYDQYIEAGATVIVIAQGEPERSEAYAKKYEMPKVAILSDAEYRVYEAFGLLDGKEFQILMGASDEYLKRDYELGVEFAKQRREADRPLVDSSWLLPGEFVVDKSGIVRLAYRYHYCVDFPDREFLMAGIKDATELPGE